jgi:hypothetical protein
MRNFLIWNILFYLSVAAAIKLPKKHLAGPPEEFAEHRIPDTKFGAVVERSAYYPISFGKTSDSETLYWSIFLEVDSTSKFAFSFFSPIESKVNLALTDPDGKAVDIKGKGIKVLCQFNKSNPFYITLDKYTTIWLISFSGHLAYWGTYCTSYHLHI